jgi:hypothetical protein
MWLKKIFPIIGFWKSIIDIGFQKKSIFPNSDRDQKEHKSWKKIEGNPLLLEKWSFILRD